MFKEANRIYQESQVDKDEDFLWARYATRPFAAFFLALFAPLKLTPNQWTLVSLLVGLSSSACFALYPGYTGLWVAWILCQLSFTVDCMDGMVARSQKMYSPVGQKFDFLVDEIKTLFLFPAIGFRLYQEGANLSWLLPKFEPVWWLIIACFGAAVVASGLSMTVFLRSPEFTGNDKQATRSYPKGLVGLLFRFLSFLLNYPSWILFPVIFSRMDVFFLVSISLYLLHMGYAGLKITLRIGRRSHYTQPTP